MFGFEQRLVVPNEDGTIVHPQLSFGNGTVMSGSVSKAETEFGRVTRQPDEIIGAETQSPYLIVSDADAVYQRAKAAGRIGDLREVASGSGSHRVDVTWPADAAAGGHIPA